MNITNGYVACGIESYIISKVKQLINSGCRADNILLLTLNSDSTRSFADLEIENVSVKSYNKFVNDILKKIKIEKPNVISDFMAIQAIFSISKKQMAKNSALTNLSKSISFSRELYNLFGLFKVNNISVEELLDINSTENIKQTDKDRFKIIIEIFEEYTNFLSQNKFLDYRDTVLTVVNLLKQNEVLKNNLASQYKYIFVYEAQDLNICQFELLKLINETNLELFVDKNASIQGFKGASVLENDNEIEFKTSCRNADILERALYITQGNFYFKEKSEAVEYRLFTDLQSEIEFIAKDIQNEIKNGTSPSELAILTRDNSIKANFIDILNLYAIPVSVELYSEEYQLFKYNFNRFLNMFEIFSKLNLTSFDFDNVININISSKVEEETLMEQLNLYLENVLSEILQNKYTLKEILFLKERFKNLCIAETVWKSQKNFTENDKTAVYKEFKKIDKLYQLYKKDDIVGIVIDIANVMNIVDENCNKFIAKFLSNLKQLCTLKKEILNESIDYKTISDLLDMTLEENEVSAQKVNLITFFKAAGKEFKKVYIPSLTEGYFPKKSKWTYFISASSNNVLSKCINKLHPDFGNIIKSNIEELKDEERLFYVALTTAKEKVLISTHKYENKKQIQPSSFFEQLIFSDEANFVSDELEKLDKEEVEKALLTKTQIQENPEEIVVKENEELRLSASSITTFLKCPQKFYYKHLLELNESDSFSSNYGTIVHIIFEVFLSKHIEEFSKEKLTELGLALFEGRTDETKALELGFSQENIGKIKDLSELDCYEMKENFLDAIKSLEKNAYFLAKPIKAVCEKHFTFSVDELKNVIFSGFIDAIVEDIKGYKIIDYKTGTSKKELVKLFSPSSINFISERGATKGKFSKDKMKNFEYQMPLYYIASLVSKDLEEFENSIYQIGYQYVRPNYKENGSNSDFITTCEIKDLKDKIIENLKKYIVDEIRNKTNFEAIRNQFTCENCEYNDICELSEDDDD